MRFSFPRHATALPAALLLVVLVAGCAGTSEDTGTGAATTGNYPNLNIKPGVAADQFTPEERAAKIQGVEQSRSRSVASGGATPPSQVAQMQQKARTHGPQTVAQIERGDCSPRPTCD